MSNNKQFYKDIINYTEENGKLSDRKEINKTVDRLKTVSYGIPGLENAIKITENKLQYLYANLEEQKVARDTLESLLMNDLMNDEEISKITGVDSNEKNDSTKK